jgi:hypothetical protein
MAHFKTLPDEVLTRLQTKVGVSLSRMTETLGAVAPALHESVDVWTLPASAVVEPSDDLRRLAKPSGQWHLQVKSANIPIAYARSSTLGSEPSDWSVDGIFQSELARKFDQAITWIDENIPEEDIIVRLLVIPAYQTHALWLIDENNTTHQKIVVIDAPDEYGFSFPPDIDRPQEISTFLDRLRSVKHIEGLTES